MSVDQAVFTYAQKAELTDYVNAYRAKHNSPPLVWDDTISAFAQEYSLYLVTHNLFQHSNKEGYGENLAYFQGYPNEMMTLIKKSIDLWYDEIISNLKMIDDNAIYNKMYLLNRMYYVRYALQTGRSSRMVIYALTEIAQSLSPTA